MNILNVFKPAQKEIIQIGSWANGKMFMLIFKNKSGDTTTNLVLTLSQTGNLTYTFSFQSRRSILHAVGDYYYFIIEKDYEGTHILSIYDLAAQGKYLGSFNIVNDESHILDEVATVGDSHLLLPYYFSRDGKEEVYLFNYKKWLNKTNKKELDLKSDCFVRVHEDAKDETRYYCCNNNLIAFISRQKLVIYEFDKNESKFHQKFSHNVFDFNAAYFTRMMSINGIKEYFCMHNKNMFIYIDVAQSTLHFSKNDFENDVLATIKASIPSGNHRFKTCPLTNVETNDVFQKTKKSNYEHIRNALINHIPVDVLCGLIFDYYFSVPKTYVDFIETQ